MTPTQKELLENVELFRGNITAVTIKGCKDPHPGNVALEHWKFNSDTNYTMLEVMKPMVGVDSPYLVILGFKTLWGVN